MTNYTYMYKYTVLSPGEGGKRQGKVEKDRKRKKEGEGKKWKKMEKNGKNKKKPLGASNLCPTVYGRAYHPNKGKLKQMLFINFFSRRVVWRNTAYPRSGNDPIYRTRSNLYTLIASHSLHSQKNMSHH